MTQLFNFWCLCSHPFFQTVHCCRNPLKNNNAVGVSTPPLVLRTRWPALWGTGGHLIVRNRWRLGRALAVSRREAA